MNIPRFGPITNGIIYEANIPFGWQVISNKLSATEWINFNESNRQLLQLLLKDGSMQELETISDPVSREMNRLESKIDLLISLVGTLLSKGTEIPAIRKVWLGRDGCQVLLGSPPDDDDSLAGLPVIHSVDYVPGSSVSDRLVKVSMFLDAHFPQPLNFYAKVDIVQQAGTGILMVVTFQNMDQEVQDLLEKFIFQQHRRVIASARTGYSEH